VSAPPAFHPTPAVCGPSGKQIQNPSLSCTPGQPYQEAGKTCGGTPTAPWVSTQVYAAPLAGPGPVPAVQVDACQFCAALTGTADCSGGLKAAGTYGTLASITAAVTTTALDPDTRTPTGAPLPAGAYAITVVESTGQSWTIPNELGATQAATFTVVP
jgi:hypothetical protein